MPEVVRLIDNDKVVIFLLIVAVTFDNLIKTTVGYKAAVFVFDAEICKSVFPVAFNCRWEDYKDAGIVAICGDEALRNHSSHSLAQTHHVGNEATAVLHHNVISLHHSVALVGEVVVVVGQLWNEIILDLIAEVVDEHTHI